MVRHARLSVIVTVLLVVAACGSSSPSASAPAGASPVAGAASSSAESPPPSAPPIAAGPAWTAVLGQVDAQGHVSKDTALQAFALASGVDMPGVTPPAGDPGTTASGTMALRWLGSYWDELTPDQQAAAIDAIPELAGLSQTSAVPGSISLAVARAPAGGAAPPPAKVAQYRTDAFYTQLAKLKVADIQLHLPSDVPTFNLDVAARVGLTKKSTSGMETGVYNAKGGDQGVAAKCVIVVSWLGDAQTDVDVEAEMAHEVWHCFEGQILGPARYWSQDLAPWIQEGEAEWVGNSIVPDAPLGAQAYWDYFIHPDVPLFARTYDAVGFYAHLKDAGTDPWAKLRPILEAKSNEAAFTAAGADGDPFLETWASSLLRDGGRSAAWQMTGPAMPDEARAKPVDIHLSNGGSVEESAAPYANDIAVFQEAPDVLLTTFSGRARLSDSAGHDYLADDGEGTFCLLPTGCECPGATSDEPPMLALDGARVAVGATGGPKGSNGTLTGSTLDDYCRGKGITGTWEGIWQNSPQWGGATGGFTLTVVQKGTSFTGTTDVTGPTCVRHGKVTGTVTGKHVSMGWIAAGVRDVAFDGTISGKTMSGTWSAYACKPEDLQIDGSWSATKVK